MIRSISVSFGTDCLDPWYFIGAKAVLQGGFDDLEKRGNVEITGREQRVMPRPGGHLRVIGDPAARGGPMFHDRQNGIVDALERLSDQRRADGARWLPAAQGEQTAPPACRHRRGRNR